MNPKINKLRTELEKNNGKIAALQAKNKELENLDIVGMVREQGLTMEQFAELFQKMKGAAVAAPAVKESGNET